MQGYAPPMLFSTQKPAHMHPEPDGEYVLRSEAQAEIDRLKAEVSRLQGLVIKSGVTIGVLRSTLAAYREESGL